MASQLNPAWQRKAISSDHLAKVSECFLSDPEHAEHPSDGRQVIPFLLDNPEQSWLPEDLCQALTRRGCHSRVDELPPAIDQTPINRLATTLRQQPANTELCLLTTQSPAVIHACRFDHVVLLVPASLDGVLSAYQRIKLLSSPVTPDIGIVVVGPRDQHAAWRYFRKLAVGTLRYLDIPLLNLGFVPHRVTPQNSPSDHHRDNFLARISERLLRSEFYSRCQCDGSVPESEQQ